MFISPLKTSRYLLLAATALAACSTRVKDGLQQSDKVQLIEVRKMDFYTSMITSVACDKLEQEGPYFIDTFTITDSKEISFILAQLNKAKPAADGYDVDTRGKLIIHYQSGIRDSACLGTTVIIRYNNKIMELQNRDLVKMIHSLPMKEK